MSRYAEPVDGPFATEVARVAGERDTTVVAGCSRPATTPTGPSTRSSCGARAEASYRKIHLYDSFGYRESDRLCAGPVAPALVDVAGFRVGLMTCYDLRFPNWPGCSWTRAPVLALPAAWVAGPRSRPLAHAAPRPGHREHRLRRRCGPSPDRATAVTR